MIQTMEQNFATAARAPRRGSLAGGSASVWTADLAVERRRDALRRLMAEGVVDGVGAPEIIGGLTRHGGAQAIEDALDGRGMPASSALQSRITSAESAARDAEARSPELEGRTRDGGHLLREPRRGR